MMFEIVIFFLIYILNNISTGVASKHERACQKLNVVLFFAKTSFNLPKEAEGIKVLEMHEVAHVKSSFPTPHKRGSCNVMPNPLCEEVLTETLTSLVHFSQNALGMKTAVVSVTNSKITNDISYSEQDTPPEVRERHFSQKNPSGVFQTDTSKDDENSLLQQFEQKPVNLRNVITSPEHTEVFKIRVKRQAPETENKPPGEIVDVPLDKKKKKPSWDVLDIMSHIRFSFFGNLFENEGKNKLIDEENKIADDLAETNMDPGLFETVKTTLNTLQENTEEPLFMTVFGGHLSEIYECKSPLIQSIKHVIENTDPKDTLIVLTGSCPDHKNGYERSYGFGHEHGPVHIRQLRHKSEVRRKHKGLRRYKHKHQNQRKRQNKDEEVVHIGGNNNRENENETIPVFARGPEYTNLSQCSLLFDVPVVVKSILEQLVPTFEGKHRSKRSIFGDIRMNKENYKNTGDRASKYLSLIFNLCIFIVIII